ncbi:MAG: hypothetical protein ABSG25_11395 [Bryobacteraceae bacterium]
MIEKRINSIRMKEFEKYLFSESNYQNEDPVIVFEIKGDGQGQEEQKSNRASKKALEDYRLWLHEQEKILIMYLSHIEEINSKDEIRFGKQRYIVG